MKKEMRVIQGQLVLVTLCPPRKITAKITSAKYQRAGKAARWLAVDSGQIEMLEVK